MLVKQPLKQGPRRLKARCNYSPASEHADQYVPETETEAESWDGFEPTSTGRLAKRRWSPEQLVFLKESLPRYEALGTRRKTKERELFFQSVADSMVRKFQIEVTSNTSDDMQAFTVGRLHPSLLDQRADLWQQKRVGRWFYNSSRGHRSQNTPNAPISEPHGGQARMALDRLDDDDASVLAMLFGLHLGYSKVSAFQAFTDENHARLAELVDGEMEKGGRSSKDRFAVQRQVFSAEFRRLPEEDRERYEREAEMITEQNRSFAESPASEEEILR